MPVRIFLSYGHDKYVSLAKRLKRDLEKQGYEVWFDVERLKLAADWEQYIEDGLNWAAVAPGAGRFLLLMTPHSVRRPDGYCLNELARAFGRNLPIIPVMVSDVEPPLSICRLQWLDMKNCFPAGKNRPLYAKLFCQLIKALEDKHAGFEGAQQRLLNYLQPIMHDDDINRHVSRFSGREWAMIEVDQWLASTSRVLWITGEAGVGKSALAAWLCARRPEIAAYHFCRFGNSERADPRKALFSIAYQLSTQLPLYRDRLTASPLDKIIVEGNPAAVFDRLFVSMLTDVTPTTGKPALILIEALDEATHDAKNELARLIASGFHQLPPWLRLVVTSRPHEETINFALQALDPWKLEAGRPENLDDIREYLRRDLPPLLGGREKIVELVETIVDKSEGLFLYVRWLCQELQEGRLAIKDVQKFPQGLGGVYADFFERYFTNPNEYASNCRPALESICAAREPLKREDLTAIFGWSEYEIRSLLARLGSLFPVAEGRIRPFHQSVADWLTDPLRSGLYYVDLQAGEKRLAEFAWQQYQKGVGHMSQYSVAHGLVHLAACHRRTEIREVLLDCGWMQAKLAITDPSSLAMDFEYLNGEPAVTAIQAAIRLASHALTFRPWELKTQLVGRLYTQKTEMVTNLISKILSRESDRLWLHPLSSRLSTPDGPLIRTVFAHPAEVKVVEIAASGRKAISVTDRELKAWDLETGNELATVSLSDVARDLVSAYDGAFTTILLESGVFEKWDLRRTERVRVFGRKGTSFQTSAISGNQRVFAFGTMSGSLSVWDEENRVSRRPSAHYGQIQSLALNENGSVLLSEGADGKVTVWSTEDLSREIVSWSALRHPFRTLALAPDGTRALALAQDGEIALWDTKTGDELAHTNCSLKNVAVGHLWLDCERAILLLGRHDGSIEVRDILRESPITVLQRHGGLSCLSMSRDGTNVISGSTDGTIKWWSLDRIDSSSYLDKQPREITTLVAAQNEYFVSGSVDGAISFWSAKDGSYMRGFSGTQDLIHAIWITCEGKRLVTCSRERSLWVRDAETGEVLTKLSGQPWTQIVGMTPDGQFAGCVNTDDQSGIRNVYFPLRWNCATRIVRSRTLAVSIRNLTLLQLWAIEAETELVRFVTDQLISTAVVSGDGSRFVAGSHDGTIIFCSVTSPREFRTVESHHGRVAALAVSHAGDMVITVSDDGIARIWNPESGEEISSFTGDGPLTSCAISTDGTLVAAGDSSGAVHILMLRR